jgi:hypothetical protein
VQVAVRVPGLVVIVFVRAAVAVLAVVYMVVAVHRAIGVAVLVLVRRAGVRMRVLALVHVRVLVHRSVRVAMEVGMGVVSVVAAARVDVPVHGTVGHHVLVLMVALDARLALSATAGGAHVLVLLVDGSDVARDHIPPRS